PTSFARSSATVGSCPARAAVTASTSTRSVRVRSPSQGSRATPCTRKRSLAFEAGRNGEAMSERRYLIVVEGGRATNFSAYSPDIPGVVATGATREECEREMREAIEFHLEGLAVDGEPVPEPNSSAGYAVVEIG